MADQDGEISKKIKLLGHGTCPRGASKVARKAAPAQKAEQKARPLLSRLSPLFPAKASPAAAAAVSILTT